MNGIIKAGILKNELFIIEGKDAYSMWIKGDKLTYMIKHKSYKELGYEAPQEMLKESIY